MVEVAKNLQKVINIIDVRYGGGKPSMKEIPSINNIHIKLLEAVNKPGAFDMRTWHQCGTTHCIGGWVVTLAGGKGKKLEQKYGTELAAELILCASDERHRFEAISFYTDNESAMRGLISRAVAEAKRLVA